MQSLAGAANLAYHSVKISYSSGKTVVKAGKTVAETNTSSVQAGKGVSSARAHAAKPAGESPSWVQFVVPAVKTTVQVAK